VFRTYKFEHLYIKQAANRYYCQQSRPKPPRRLPMQNALKATRRPSARVGFFRTYRSGVLVAF